ncbi:hypothetical protein [Paenibacillus cremeus]|uniref:GIY-YIG domain-containing protein n=1 Tax=Paenibacillus cremeus TaxID=2163881 RepID=A0A559JHQ0_9BACL|nr:hypothetical protein [Paenibacillus cremeus]TVX99401.1 hypothetical protein FPZ49_33890 [Paenibacillus cremeus]
MHRKKELIDHWLALYEHNALHFPPRGTMLDNKSVIQKMERHVANQNYSDSIYILRLLSQHGAIPIYIGRSNSPVSRWKSHLDRLIKGKGLYERWHEILLDANGYLKEDLDLIVILDTELTIPAIPMFPCTVGSIEYQLVSLASDAYPNTLLNHEGNRR